MAHGQVDCGVAAGELLARLKAAEDKAQNEALQRRDLETGLHQAASLFRKEILDKSQQLATFKAEVKYASFALLLNHNDWL